jgi:hypothetical protein
MPLFHFYVNPNRGALKTFVILAVLHFAGAHSRDYILKASLIAARGHKRIAAGFVVAYVYCESAALLVSVVNTLSSLAIKDFGHLTRHF